MDLTQSNLIWTVIVLHLHQLMDQQFGKIFIIINVLNDLHGYGLMSS